MGHTWQTAGNLSDLRPADPRLSTTQQYNLDATGYGWWRAPVRVSSNPPSRAHGGLPLIAAPNVDVAMWELPATFLTLEQRAAILDGPPHWTGRTPTTVPTAEGARDYYLRLHGAGTGSFTLTGPPVIGGDVIVTVVTDWAEVPAVATGYQDGHPLARDVNADFSTGGVIVAVATRDKIVDTDQIDPDQTRDIIGDPAHTSGSSAYVQWLYGRGGGEVWTEQQASLYYNDDNQVLWFNRERTVANYRYDPRRQSWAIPRPVLDDPSLAIAPAFPQWLDSDFGLTDRAQLRTYEEASSFNSEVEYHLQRGVAADFRVSGYSDPDYPTPPGLNAKQYQPRTPAGGLLVNGRAVTREEPRADLDGTVWWVAANQRAGTTIVGYPTDAFVGQSVAWTATFRVEVYLIVRAPRYRWAIRYVTGGTVRPLRQRQRQDGLAIGAPRQFARNRPKSKQISVRAGWEGTYLTLAPFLALLPVDRL